MIRVKSSWKWPQELFKTIGFARAFEKEKKIRRTKFKFKFGIFVRTKCIFKIFIRCSLILMFVFFLYLRPEVEKDPHGWNLENFIRSWSRVEFYHKNSDKPETLDKVIGFTDLWKCTLSLHLLLCHVLHIVVSCVWAMADLGWFCRGCQIFLECIKNGLITSI